MVYHYTRLCTIIHYYCTIIHCYYNYCNITIISLLSEVDVSSFEQNKHQGWAKHRGYHVGEESQRLDHLVRSLTWTCGSPAHERGSRLLGGPPSAQARVSSTGCGNSGSVAGVRPGQRSLFALVSSTGWSPAHNRSRPLLDRV